MPAKTKSSRRPTDGTTSRKLVCPECGFKAAHPMGLGRHRSSRHGVPSKRELYERRVKRQASSGARSTEIAKLHKRLRALEERHDRLIAALLRATRAGRSRV